ncbi:MAG: hypothetical protein E6J34_01510 [Chloroflexi bacterium]|nr:MAG: hypothetical protein E6J34_01510 [Chloroflexota bacterium]
METGQSEVARLLQHIALEYEAAGRGLHGLASGAAKHEFITNRMESIQQAHVALQGIVGSDDAIRLVAQTLEKAGG